MDIRNLTTPKRAWINNPSTTQPYHAYHGKTGIAVLDPKTQLVTLYFTEGAVHSMLVNPLHLTQCKLSAAED